MHNLAIMHHIQVPLMLRGMPLTILFVRVIVRLVCILRKYKSLLGLFLWNPLESFAKLIFIPFFLKKIIIKKARPKQVICSSELETDNVHGQKAYFNMKWRLLFIYVGHRQTVIIVAS